MMFFVCRVLCLFASGNGWHKIPKRKPPSKKGFRGGVSKTYAMWYQCNHLAV